MTHAVARARSRAPLPFIVGAGLAALAAISPALAGGQTPGERPSAAVLQPLVETQNAFTAVAEQVTPAVVSIQVERLGRDARTGSAAYQRAGSGSGFIVSKDGYILTNNHVVAGANRVRVTLLDKRVFTARVVGTDPTTDVAVIRIEGADLPVATLGDDEQAKVGQWVLAIGNPLGLDFSVTSGIVSAKGRNIPGLNRSLYAITDFIQTDAAINMGNSGGPLVNIRGEVVGINSAIISPTGLSAGYGFAIPITLAREVMDDLVQYGAVRRGVLGLSLAEVSAPDAERLGLRSIRGALVQSFSGAGSPARAAGVREQDVIVAANGRPVDRVGTLQRIVRSHEPGDVVVLTVLRGGREQTARVRLAEAPPEAQVAELPGN